MLTLTLILEHSWNTGLLIHLVQNIYVHKGESSLPKHSQDSSCTNSTGRIFSGDVCGDSSYSRTEGTKNVWAWIPECYENNVRSRRLRNSIFVVSDVDVDENIVSMSGTYEPFVQLCPLLSTFRRWQYWDHGVSERKIIFMNLLHFLDAASTWNLTRTTWSQKNLPWRHDVQELFQVP